MMNNVVGYNTGRRQGVWTPRIEVAVETRKAARRDGHSDAMTGLKRVGRGPQVHDELVHLMWREQRRVRLRTAIARTQDAITQQAREAIGAAFRISGHAH